ncbi:MAG: hypothetical protein A2Z81_06485 [Omnitrophica WOR_2 bacterium GWA2_45_18]|nr:MAG: hypothetical protein A2Z81_06485 [Omnitrophica WOR_2 bacterium GWA2_45_18]
MKNKLIPIAGVVLLLTIPAGANQKQIKFYKKAFSTKAPNCVVCHISKTPEKEEGKHEFNEYGLKIKKENDKPTLETYLKVGKPEEPKKEEIKEEEAK